MDFNSSVYARVVNSTLHVDDNVMFCGSPYLSIVAWNGYLEVGVAVHDYDDFDIGVIYKCASKEEQEQVFHELINYAYDLRNAVINTGTIFDLSFFPDLGVPMRNW